MARKSNFLIFRIVNIYKEVNEVLKRRSGVMNKITDEVIKELNWKEKIIVKIFAKTFNKVHNITRIKIINALIK